MGLYKLLTHDVTVIRAINPANIYLFFKKNSTNRWSALGGCVLCITGAEATFADLGHFSMKSIQPTFGAVGRSGVMSIAESLDKLGPFCRNSADCVIVLVFWISFGGRTQMMFHPETFPSQILLQLTEDADICYDRIKDIPCITCPNKPEESMFVMVKPSFEPSQRHQR
ncbi:potassium transporter 4 isoform X1 [Capsicum annuum]|uniref:potassium transporter 4 isoform X1 n=1 Tax=Capsicum annuum TaxID=4072 RepID=UPI0007BFC1EF|nr:potassium transporter 4 isoform X1 [Capsicum annuum]XP_047256430.1 potassium transporter 4 isoform X1 [Capsicum annuum]XP_047256431.1 potassium transporter 4 isoform X1 [Capsicum annuum]XP_047256432.1 potassium transporter 4 isoform X1 [Capsicum annuum]XP_047256433.1 potassium transporter 4 isoform X1 [Capsicum annuum]XP_047256434.1 potassium transporter 4 isoform X1 [Capsicum annuum]XP_047256435.1 potassium transporter 4 isoform X1 [Capsicum annuum]XP_047256436.1 potassium transporter 4 